MPPLTGSRSLESEHEFGAIKQATFERTLKDYRTAITPIEDGEQLDKMRYSTIPSAIESRGQDPYLDKEELVALVTWKLKHGVFRPALKGLVQQNSAKDVKQTSRKGFTEFRDGKCKESIKTLSSLKGIGPATASLMLSVFAPEKAPFFSDELFRWTLYGSGKGNGWDRRIKYTAKEYDEMYEKVQELLSRLDASAVDAEKVAYVLGKNDPLLAGTREDLTKSSKRKAGKLEGSSTDRSGSQNAITTTLTAERPDAVSKEIPSRISSDTSPPRDNGTDPTADVEKDRPSDAGLEGRPKRKRRR